MKKVSLTFTFEIEIHGKKQTEAKKRELLANMLIENCAGVINSDDCSIVIHSMERSAPQLPLGVYA